MNEKQSPSTHIPPKGEPLAYNVTEVETVDTVAAVFLGIFSFILLIALLRSQAQVRSLMSQLSGKLAEN